MRTPIVKTHPRKRSIHKLFTNFTTDLFGQVRPYSETKVSNFVAWTFYLHELFRVEPYISSFRGTFSPLLGFRLLGEYKYSTTTKPFVIQRLCIKNINLNPSPQSSIHPSLLVRVFSRKKIKILF